jgi:hypothetical protein
MGSQSSSMQNRIIAEARRWKQMATLLWFVEIEAPRSMKTKNRYVPACYPGDWIPMLKVEEPWEVSRHMAGLLADLLRESGLRKDPDLWRNAGFSVAITTTDVVAEMGVRWYLWGEDGPSLDHVCPACGQVWSGPPSTWAGCDCVGPAGAPRLFADWQRSRSFSWVDGPRGGSVGVMLDLVEVA